MSYCKKIFFHKKNPLPGIMTCHSYDSITGYPKKYPYYPYTYTLLTLRGGWGTSDPSLKSSETLNDIIVDK